MGHNSYLKIIFIILYAAVFLASCGIRQYTTYNDVATGVMLNENEVVMADRNVGAEVVCDNGSYFDRHKAKRQCPKGYHIMAAAEARALIIGKIRPTNS